MKKERLNPYFRGRSIGRVSTLARMFKVDENELLCIAERAASFYRPGKRVPKKDGSYRETIKAIPPLVGIQARIMAQILREVKYPTYLQGSIRDRDNPRDYVRNASIHVRAKTLISEDIKKFFPNTSFDVVYDIWRGFFGYSDEVSECLSMLTTMNGELPQGTKTSSYIANLVFWRDEPAVAHWFNRRGIRYSRLTDDICVSSKRRLNKREISESISKIYGMLKKKGYHLNRKKHHIYNSGQRMVVNNLVVNRKASLPREDKSKARSAVHEIEKFPTSERSGDSFLHAFHSSSGKVSKVRRLHGREGKALRERLNRNKPH